MIKKLLVICGPTASGKTNLAINLAGKFNGELVSADSRQVYECMDIGTGKDVPSDSKFKTLSKSNILRSGRQNSKPKYGCYQTKEVKIWGYDLVAPTVDFNVSRYADIAAKFVTDIWRRRHLPIIVGGTGLYIKSLIDGVETSSIPPDPHLREILGEKKADELFRLLNNLDEMKAKRMNNSDRKNPRRLIRAIEIARRVKSNKLQLRGKIKKNYDSILMIGLKAPNKVLAKRIESRVMERIRGGFEEEMNKLLVSGVDWRFPSMLGLGYRQFREFYKGDISRKEFIKRWIMEERRYSKRQMTWFAKDKRINWFDISLPNFKTEVENKVQSWYYEKERK